MIKDILCFLMTHDDFIIGLSVSMWIGLFLRSLLYRYKRKQKKIKQGSGRMINAAKYNKQCKKNGYDAIPLDMVAEMEQLRTNFFKEEKDD